MQPRELVDDCIIEQAVRRAKHSGWTVVPDDCFIQGIATAQALRTGRLHAWIVYMAAQPCCNPSAQQVRYLRCRVEMLGDGICAGELQELSESGQNLRSAEQPK